MDRPSDAARVLQLTQSRLPTLGTGRLICLDGPTGSGKSSLASLLGAPVVHTDDLIDGWTGLRTIDAQLDGLLRPLAAGQPGSYRRYDWGAGDYAETVVVPPAPLLVLEGVGAGSLVLDDLATVVVWVEAPYEVRKSRALLRDGEAFAPHWHTWETEELDHFVRNRTLERADLVIRT